MKRSFYGEADYAFGQAMLTLRTSIGLTQAGLAELLGVSRRAIGKWEAGGSYPKASHLKALLAFAVGQRAFAAGREEEEIRAFWHAAHQKVLLDEAWLQGLLGTQRPRLVLVTAQSDEQVLAQPALGPRVDWGDALDVPSFYGREEELATLEHWVGEARCRVVSVLGMGGIGKSALAVTVMHRVATQFEVVIWRSLRDAPGCSALLEACLQVLAPQPLPELPDSLEGRLHLLMEQLRARRVLLVLDNLEMLLEEGEGTGCMRAGFEGYARLLRRMGETAHQSCLLLTSREKPTDLVPLEGSRSPVHAVRLAGLDGRAGRQLLEAKDVAGTAHDRERLVEVYRGNPLALKIVAHTIVELFGGEIVPFLEQGEVVFGGVRELLDEQFDRLSALEQAVFYWLAILREPVSLEELLAVFSRPRTAVQVLEALEGLGRRSLIEHGPRAGSFTLQSVVLEYATARLVAEASRELEQGQLVRLIQHGLVQAHAKDYVRQVQERLLLAPVLAHVQSVAPEHANVEAQVGALLDKMRALPENVQGYGPANLVTLLRVLRGDLRGLDLSHLALRGVYLQGVEMQDATLTGALMRESVWTSTFDAIWAVAISRSEQYWAAGSRRGEVWVWEREQEAGQTLHQVWQAHSANAFALAFSPDGGTLASASWDGSVKLWELESGRCLQTLVGHTERVQALAWSPDGRTLASGSFDHTIRLWDGHEGSSRVVLQGHSADVYSVGWSPDGSRLASSGWDSAIRLWDPTSGSCIQIIGDSDSADTPFYGVAWSPDGQLLACGTYLRGLQVWDVTARCRRWVGEAHATWIRRLAWSPDGTRVVGGGDDGHVYLWDASDGTQLLRLVGHHGAVTSVAWGPDGMRLASGGSGREGGELFVWDAHSGQRVHAFAGHPGVVSALTWASSGELVVSGGSDGRVRWWEVQSGQCVRVREAHQGTVQALKVSPDGSTLASCGDDGAINIWDLESSEPLRTLRRDRPYERLDITGIRGLTQAQKATLRALGAIEDAAVDSP